MARPALRGRAFADMDLHVPTGVTGRDPADRTCGFCIVQPGSGHEVREIVRPSMHGTSDVSKKMHPTVEWIDFVRSKSKRVGELS